MEPAQLCLARGSHPAHGTQLQPHGVGYGLHQPWNTQTLWTVSSFCLPNLLFLLGKRSGFVLVLFAREILSREVLRGKRAPLAVLLGALSGIDHCCVWKPPASPETPARLRELG